MVYTVPKSKKAKPSARFEFNLEGAEKVYSLPLLKNLKPAFALRLSTDPAVAVVRLFEEYCPEALDALEDSEELDALFAAWKSESGVDLGESSASAAS